MSYANKGLEIMQKPGFTKLLLLGAIVVTTFLTLWSVSLTMAHGQGSPRSALDDHRVVLIGDSQVAGAFGREMGPQLIARGVVYYTRSGQVGWGVNRWWRVRNQLRRLIRRHQPSLLLVELGGNDWERSARSDYEEEVRRFWNYLNEEMQHVHNETETKWRVVWISPAQVVGRRGAEMQPGRDRAARKIRSVVTDRNYVESRDVTGTFGRTPDGLHFTAVGARDWARAVVPRIETCLNR
jgi:lysophospholipase L1-like esterase